jgi:hypothetical protein
VPSNEFGSTNAVPSNWIYRPLMNILTIQEELHEELTHDIKPSTKSSKTPSNTSSTWSSTIQKHNPPIHLRQTTLDLFLNIHLPQHNWSPSADKLQKRTGFRNIHKIMKINQRTCSTHNWDSRCRLRPVLVMWRGCLPKSCRNTSPIPFPAVFGSVICHNILDLVLACLLVFTPTCYS